MQGRSSKSQSGPRLPFGWAVVATSSLTLFVVFGIRLSFTVFFVALTDEFQWPRASTSLIFSVSMIVFAASSTAAGMALDRWGARAVFGTGAILLALGLMLSSQIQAYWHLVLTYGCIAGLGITVLGLGVQAGYIARWFSRRRGIALGLAFAGTGLGTLVLTPGVERLIALAGWRKTYIALAGLVLLIIPAILLFMRSSPVEESAIDDDRHVLAGGRESDHGERSWSLPEAVRTAAFWLLIVASLGAIGPLRMLTVHQMAAVLDAGFDRFFAASVIGLSGAVTAISFVVFGALSDLIGRRAAYAIGSVCLIAAVVILGSLRSANQAGWLSLYALMLGMGEGSRSSLVTATASDLFPGAALGAINGSVGAAFGLGAAVFPWLAGYLYDLSESYQAALGAAGAAIVLSTITLWLAPSAAARGSG